MNLENMSPCQRMSLVLIPNIIKACDHLKWTKMLYYIKLKEMLQSWHKYLKIIEIWYNQFSKYPKNTCNCTLNIYFQYQFRLIHVLNVFV
jgi:hypothetical protein